MENWLPFSAFVLQKLYEDGYNYFVFENSPPLNSLFPLGKQKVTVAKKYLCRVFPYKNKDDAEKKEKEKEENYTLHYDEPIICLANARHFVAVIVF